jgi:hypothetical protein
MAAHLDRHERNRQCDAHPHAPPEIDQLVVGRRFRRDHDGFQRHAADRA